MIKRSLFIAWALLLLGACNQDPCAALECLNGGTCIDGSCECPEGFIGADCSIELDPCAQANCDPIRTDSCLVLNFNEARCICLTGFEGDQCDDRWEDKFLDTYTAAEICNGTSEVFTLEIKIGPDPMTVALQGFNNQSGVATTVVGKMINATVFDIQQQFMAFGTVSGAGQRQGDGLVNLNYQIITANQDTLVCTAALSPQ